LFSSLNIDGQRLYVGDCLPQLAAVRLQPKFWLGRRVLAACLSACNQMPEAEKATAELMRDYPGLTSDEFAAWFPYANPDDGKLVTEALRRAGWQ
jgi:hypothetical protein